MPLCDPATLPFRRVLMVGGHSRIRGGLEIFIERAMACLGVDNHLYSETPGSGQSFGRYIGGLREFFRRASACDIVWLHYGSAFDLAYVIAAKLAGKKIVVTPHLGEGWRSMKNGAVRAVCNAILARADGVFTLYENQAEALRLPKARCRTMGTFLPPDLLTATPVQNDRFGPLKLIHVARLSAEKGSFAFLDVCRALAQRGVKYEATMIGLVCADVRRALINQIAHGGLQVSLHPPMDHAALIKEFRRHDVLVNLSVQDAYPLTVLEALLCGLPVLATDLPGTREIAADASALRLIAGQNAEAAADVVATLPPPSPDSIGRLRRKFAWDTLVRRYRDAFEEIVSGRSRS